MNRTKFTNQIIIAHVEKQLLVTNIFFVILVCILVLVYLSLYIFEALIDQMKNSSSSRSQIFLKLSVYKNFANFRRKLNASNFIKNNFQPRCFPVKFAKFSQNTFSGCF